MIHGLNNNFLYSAKKITVGISNGTDNRCIQGTGFFVNKDNHIILVTNRHVVEPSYCNPMLQGYYIKSFSIESYKTFDNYGLPKSLNTGQVINYNDFIVAEDSANDVACLSEAKIKGAEFVINSPINYEMLAEKKWIDEKLCVCDGIAYPGFPEWYDKKNNTPIFRSGTIASDPRLDYSYNDNIKKGALVAYEGFSTGGSSGSPVFAIQKGFPVGDGIKAPSDFYREVKLVGINAGHLINRVVTEIEDNNMDEIVNYNSADEKDYKQAFTNAHSGISYFYKSSVIVDIIKKCL